MIACSALSKRFGATRAVRDATFEIAAGETVVLTGENGSGKSTLLKMIAGLVRPTSGSVTIGGRAPRGAKSEIGFLGHDHYLYPHLTTWENLRLFARLYGVDDSVAQHKLEQVRLADRSDTLAGSLSRGQAQRLALARCLLHDPSVLLLDEPLTGLDEASVAAVPAWIARPERTTLIVTHDERAMPLATRSMVIEDGFVS